MCTLTRSLSVYASKLVCVYIYINFFSLGRGARPLPSIPACVCGWVGWCVVGCGGGDGCVLLRRPPPPPARPATIPKPPCARRPSSAALHARRGGAAKRAAPRALRMARRAAVPRLGNLVAENDRKGLSRVFVRDPRPKDCHSYLRKVAVTESDRRLF